MTEIRKLSRFAFTAFFLIVIWKTGPHHLKLQLCFLIASIPQIWRKKFAEIWPRHAKRIRIELGPIAALFFLASFFYQDASPCFSPFPSFLVPCMGVGLGIWYVPDEKRRVNSYSDDKKKHGRIMRVIFWGEFMRFMMGAIALMINCMIESNQGLGMNQ